MSTNWIGPWCRRFRRALSSVAGGANNVGHRDHRDLVFVPAFVFMGGSHGWPSDPWRGGTDEGAVQRGMGSHASDGGKRIRRSGGFATAHPLQRVWGYIVNGKEYQVANQWQSRPGAYTKRGSDGVLSTKFNVVNRLPFELSLDPESGRVTMDYRTAKLPVYPLIRALGASDAEIEKRLGTATFNALRCARHAGRSHPVLQVWYEARSGRTRRKRLHTS